MDGGIGTDLHVCYYLDEFGFDINDMKNDDKMAYVDMMTRFYKAEIARCIENGNFDALPKYEKTLSDMLLKHKRITEKTHGEGDDNTKKHQEVLEELFPLEVVEV